LKVLVGDFDGYLLCGHSAGEQADNRQRQSGARAA